MGESHARKGFTAEEYEAAYERLGSYAAVAREFGVDPAVPRRAIDRLRAKRQRAAETDPGIAKAAAEAGITDLTDMHSGWVKAESGSFYFMLPKDKQNVQSLVDQVKEAMSDAPKAAELPLLSYDPMSEYLTVYPLADIHLGMLAWSGETGADYDVKIAAQRVGDWMGRAVDAAPPAERAVVIFNGDTLHINDQTNQTQGSHHQLDADTRYFKVLDVATRSIIAAVRAALCKHAHVTVVLLKGNHDPEAYVTLMWGLYYHFEDEPRVEVQKKPGDFFVYEFGNVMIAANHGDKAGAQRLVNFISARWAQMWGRTTYRYLFTGHLHHYKAGDIGGMVWEQLAPITDADYYAFSHAFAAGRAQLSAITYHRDEGVKFRSYINA